MLPGHTYHENCEVFFNLMFSMACGLPLLTRQKLPTHAEINVKLTKLDIFFGTENFDEYATRCNSHKHGRFSYITCIRTCMHT